MPHLRVSSHQTQPRTNGNKSIVNWHLEERAPHELCPTGDLAGCPCSRYRCDQSQNIRELLPTTPAVVLHDHRNIELSGFTCTTHQVWYARARLMHGGGYEFGVTCDIPEAGCRQVVLHFVPEPCREDCQKLNEATSGQGLSYLGANDKVSFADRRRSEAPVNPLWINIGKATRGNDGSESRR